VSDAIYTDAKQRTHALHLGMWLFLGSETLLFAGLFALYTSYREAFSAEFRAGIAHNNALIGTANTAVLIVSSFFVAWGIHALRRARRRACIASLCVAVGLGALFLVFKSIEYSEHVSEGLVPGKTLFLTLYYLMTGLHGLHVIAGMALLAWLAVRVKRGRTHAEHRTELELGGLYWHLVDVVWIFLWPLLYLTHR
jgi:cytochrome c oxidase subunit 3